MEDKYSFAVASGTLFLAEETRVYERDTVRQQKMERVIAMKRTMLKAAFPESMANCVDTIRPFRGVAGEWSQDQAMTLLIDLAFTSPFAPYELNVVRSAMDRALRRAAETLRLGPESAETIRTARSDALAAHRQIDWGKVFCWGAAGAVLLALGGSLAAPTIAVAIGTATGLSGAAAMTHGLAVLGGGSLAIGGWGMAGGMWVVGGAGGVSGLALGGAGKALLELGAPQAEAELVKLQVQYQVILDGGQKQRAEEIALGVSDQCDQLREELEGEQGLNEDRSARVRNIEATLTAVCNSLDWMRRKAAECPP